MCVLLIDHDEEFRMTLASEIVNHGYDVAHARNIHRAVRVLERLWPRCLLLIDLDDEQTGGLDLRQHAALPPGFEGACVAFMTTDPSLAPPGAPVLRKPVAAELLAGLLRWSGACRTRRD